MSPPLPPLISWAAQASNACSSIISHSRHKMASHKSQNIGHNIGSRSMGFAMALEEHGNSADFMRRAKHDGSTVPTHEQTKLKGGGMSTAPADILKARFDQFHNWFAARKAGPGGGPYEGRQDVSDLYLPSRRPEEFCVAYAVTFNELKAAIASAPSTSCPGPSGISIPLIKLFPDEYIETLRVQFNLMLAWGVLPKLFNKGFIFPIPKKGEMSIDNSRPISLLEVHLKLLTRIINRRMVYALLDAEFFAEEQFGFLPGRSCPDAFHILLGAIEDAAEFGKEIHVCLVDLTKAFDSLAPESLQQSYSAAGLSPRSADFLGAMDGKGTAQVLTPFGPTKPLKLEWGVRQGEVLSPLKFITWLNPWLTHIAEAFPDAGYMLQDGTRVTLLAYADDVAIVANSHAAMQAITADLCDFLRYHGVTLSADDVPDQSKTQYMTNRLDYSNLDPKLGPRPFALSLDCFNRASRPGAYKIPLTRTIQAQSDKFIFVYLGGRLNLALDWTEITKRARAGINRELCRLQRKRYTLAEAAAVASSIIQGKAGFLLQLAQFPLGMLQKWDSQLDRILRLKAGSAFSGSAAMFHAPKEKGGLGIFSFQSLATQSLGTELLVRLQSKGIGGKVARARLHAAERKWPDHGLASSPGTKLHFTLHCLNRLHRRGYTLCTPRNTEQIQHRYAKEQPLSSIISDSELLLKLDSYGLRFHSEVFYDNVHLVVRPWEELRRRHAPRVAPEWYNKLLALNDRLFVREGYNGPPLDPWRDGRPYTYSSVEIAERERRARARKQADVGSGFLWPITPRPEKPLTISAPLSDAYFFATDGSLKDGVGSYASVTPHRVVGWSPSSKGAFHSRSKAYKRLGSEPLSIGTMELLAVLEVLELGPDNNLIILTDSAYVMLGMKRHSRGTRSLVRQCDRSLWMRATAALARRSALGFFCTFAKCSSHDKDPEQEALVSLWNNRADKAAESARISGPPVSLWWTTGDMGHVLLHHGCTVRGDPRCHIRTNWEYGSLEHAASLNRGSSLASLTSSCPPQLAIGPLRALHSSTRLARAGLYSAQGFVFCLHNSCLRTPWNNFSGVDSDTLEAFLPKRDGKHVCPLCGGNTPNEFHYAVLCPVTAAIRSELRATVASLLIGLYTAQDYEGEYLHLLMDWFASQVGESPESVSIFAEPHGVQNKIGLRILLGRTEQGKVVDTPAPRSHKDKVNALIDRVRVARGLAPKCASPPPASTVTRRTPVTDTGWATNFAWPLLLCTASRFQEIRDTPGRSPIRAILCFPRDRFPLTSVEGSTVFSSDAVCLCLLSRVALPEISQAGVSALSSLLTRNTFLGTWGMVLSWNRVDWQLDTVPPGRGEEALAHYSLLPLDPPTPPRGVWSPALTWMGILPQDLGPLQELLEPLRPARRLKVKLLLSQTIIAAQKRSWDMSFDMIQQFLIRQKRVEAAAARNRRPPRWYPIFSRVSHFNSIWPPSQKTTSYATSFLASGEAVSSVAFNKLAPTLGIPISLRACTWLRVIQIRVRLGKKGVQALVDDCPLSSREGRVGDGAIAATWRPAPVARPPISGRLPRRNPRAGRLSGRPVPTSVEPPVPAAVRTPQIPLLLGPLRRQETAAAGSFDMGGPLRRVLLNPSRLADGRWYDGEIFAALTKPLTRWANLFCPSSLNDLTQWHVYGPMVYGYLAGSPGEWPESLAKRLEARMAKCQRVAFLLPHSGTLVARGC